MVIWTIKCSEDDPGSQVSRWSSLKKSTQGKCFYSAKVYCSNARCLLAFNDKTMKIVRKTLMTMATMMMATMMMTMMPMSPLWDFSSQWAAAGGVGMQRTAQQCHAFTLEAIQGRQGDTKVHRSDAPYKCTLENIHFSIHCSAAWAGLWLASPLYSHHWVDHQ